VRPWNKKLTEHNPYARPNVEESLRYGLWARDGIDAPGYKIVKDTETHINSNRHSNETRRKKEKKLEWFNCLLPLQ